MPQFVKDIFLLYEDQSKVFDFCSLIYNIAQDLEIAPEDKKMIFNTFYLKLTESIEENKKYLKSPSSDKKYIADSIKILNDVYTSIEKELPKTGIFNYINLSDRKFEQPKQNNFILNKDYKLDASAFCGRLKKANFIDNKTKEASLKNLFSQDNKSTVIWIGHKNALYYLIKSIKEKGIIENRHYKNIVNQIFTNSNKDSIKLPNGSLKEKDLPTSYIIQEIEKIISSSFIKKNNWFRLPPLLPPLSLI